MYDRKSLLTLLASLALAASLGACSKGSPTEPTIAFDSSSKSLATSSAFADAGKRGGGDDGSADDSGGSGGGGSDDGTADQGPGNDDDGTADQGHGNDDGTADRGPGNDDDGTADRGPGADDGTADRGPGADDGTSGQGSSPATPADPGGHRRHGRGNQPQQPQQPRGAREFAGMVTAVAGSTLVLADGTRVVVDAKTQWSNRGDVRSLRALAAALAADDAPRVEGRGQRLASGAILASTIKAEIDN
jgi:hypothetical protein